MSNQDVIARLSKAREDLVSDASALMAAAAEANRDLLPEEEDRLAEIKADVEKRAERIAALEAQEQEAAKAAELRSKYDGVLATQGVSVTPGRSEEIYRADGNYSFFADIAAARSGDLDAATRLSRHNKTAGGPAPRASPRVPRRHHGLHLARWVHPAQVAGRPHREHRSCWPCRG